MKTYDIHQPIVFKRGVYKLNDNKGLDFQLNRLISWDGGRLEDVQPVSHSIKTVDDWKAVLISLGDKAMEEDRIENAIGYYRMSEFLMRESDPDKLAYYHKARDLFYEYYADYFKEGVVELMEVPYESWHLPIMHTKPETESKGTILLHGGNDSYYEEFFFPMLYLKEQGYEVYLFEGPGQGSVLRDQNCLFDYQWEKPVKAVLDGLNLDDVTIVGASLGGYFAPRAAAFEKRITRVVAWTVFPSFLGSVLSNNPAPVSAAAKAAVKLHLSWPINKAFEIGVKKKDPSVEWVMNHGLPSYGADSAFEYCQKLEQFDLTPVAKNITQDLLIITANQDHFVNYKYVGEEIKLLDSVKSLTFRLITDKEDGGNHCSAGNSKLVMDTIVQWLHSLDVRDE